MLISTTSSVLTLRKHSFSSYSLPTCFPPCNPGLGATDPTECEADGVLFATCVDRHRATLDIGSLLHFQYVGENDSEPMNRVDSSCEVCSEAAISWPVYAVSAGCQPSSCRGSARGTDSQRSPAYYPPANHETYSEPLKLNPPSFAFEKNGSKAGYSIMGPGGRN